MSRKVLLDANTVLRYLLDDIHEQHEKARETIENNDCVCILSSLQEVVYVMEGYYDIPRPKIVNALTGLSDIVQIEDEDVFVSALHYYAEKQKIDFVDCVMCGYKVNRNVDILSFDKKLMNKLNEI